MQLGSFGFTALSSPPPPGPHAAGQLAGRLLLTHAARLALLSLQSSPAFSHSVGHHFQHTGPGGQARTWLPVVIRCSMWLGRPQTGVPLPHGLGAGTLKRQEKHTDLALRTTSPAIFCITRMRLLALLLSAHACCGWHVLMHAVQCVTLFFFNKKDRPQRSSSW